MPSVSEINQEYTRIARLVLAGRHAEAKAPALELRHLLTREPGLAYMKRCADKLLAQIARGQGSNGQR